MLVWGRRGEMAGLSPSRAAPEVESGVVVVVAVAVVAIASS